MKVTIDINENIEMDEVIIRCYYINEKVEKIERYLKSMDSSIYGASNGEMITISPDEILYFERIYKKIFVYLKIFPFIKPNSTTNQNHKNEFYNYMY